ncbi:Peptidoglycan glycosyltransferase [Chlorobium phaeobacteroides DSM 266]|uniref:Peptidoglycan glycosyltransferase n=2 Tax=Chlorobium phaeobacteroides TaxID=1096 RepID=A1BJY4_CHLPD|nr:Peptidoglycan glycosyltransferase [Chlorobium phaeobacteroides DSM 266]
MNFQRIEKDSAMNDNLSHTETGDKRFGQRLGFVVLLFFVFLVAIILMLLNIQVVNVRKYQEKALKQYVRIVTEKAQRGIIIDRHGRMLAETVETISFYADPKKVRKTPVVDKNGKMVVDRKSRELKTHDNTAEIAKMFSEVTGQPQRFYLKALRKRKGVAVLARKLPVAKALPLMQQKIHGVWFDKEQQRYYLNVAAQVIGVTDSKNKGISGLELQLDKSLRGQDGSRIYQRSANGTRYPAPDVLQQDPEKGNSVQLTIDADIQSIVEDELAKAVVEFQAGAASGIVMDVRSGEILAMASNPTYDLNRRATWTPERSRNRAVTDSYEPGSTFKIVMASAGTEVLHRKAEDMVFAHNGVLPFGRLRIRDHEAYGNITFQQAVMYSSNVIAAKTAMAVGPEKFYAYTKNFGFGSKSGVGLIGESPGFVRSLKKWDKTTLPWMGYGYQVMVTPLQMVQAYAALANDGELMRPFVVKKVMDREGKVIRENTPQTVRKVVTTETARYLAQRYFKAVVDSGTAKKAAIPGISVAGKTGTARRARNGSYANPVFIASFVGFFPVESPRYAMIILVEEPRGMYYGGTVAAPVFSSIATRMLACSEELQKNLAFRAPEQGVIDAIATVAVPDLHGLKGKDAKRLLEWLGLVMEYTGDSDGLVVYQNVTAGVPVDKESIIRVKLAMKTVKRTSL